MDSRRQLKIGSVIQEAFTSVLSRDGKGIYGSAFVTVTRIKVTSDLSLARFYLSIFNTPDGEAVIKKLYEHKFEIKRKLAEKLRHQLRVIPELEFFKDDSLDYAYHIEEVFKKIKKDDARIEADTKKPEPETKAKKTSTKTKAPRKSKSK
jgi:ribosome-binding factor A